MAFIFRLINKGGREKLFVVGEVGGVLALQMMLVLVGPGHDGVVGAEN